jgi:hypothetical protein
MHHAHPHISITNTIQPIKDEMEGREREEKGRRKGGVGIAFFR